MGRFQVHFDSCSSEVEELGVVEEEEVEVEVEEEGVVEEVQKPLVQIESLVSLLGFSAAVVVFEPLSCSNCHDVVGSSSFQWCTLKKPSDCEQRFFYQGY